MLGYAKGTSVNNKRVLVVETDSELLEMYSITLQQAGYEVYSACDSKSACDFIQRNPIDMMAVSKNHTMYWFSAQEAALTFIQTLK